MARQGTDRSPHAERGHDLYETPEEATRALVREAILPHVIWEPCAGRGAIAHTLMCEGRTVIASDVQRYPKPRFKPIELVDFFELHQPPFEAFPKGLGSPPTIVTNPPYMRGDDFIRHALALGCETWVLMRLAYLEGDRKSDIIDRHLDQILIGIERLPAMHRDGWTGPKVEKATMPFAWFHFTAKKRPLGAGFKARRISWRGDHR
jgi:methylase of polypeptide subunit release factors